jgi:hypothetical protein
VHWTALRFHMSSWRGTKRRNNCPYPCNLLVTFDVPDGAVGAVQIWQTHAVCCRYGRHAVTCLCAAVSRCVTRASGGTVATVYGSEPGPVDTLSAL